MTYLTLNSPYGPSPAQEIRLTALAHRVGVRGAAPGRRPDDACAGVVTLIVL
jgi:hypothetical protein